MSVQKQTQAGPQTRSEACCHWGLKLPRQTGCEVLQEGYTFHSLPLQEAIKLCKLFIVPLGSGYWEKKIGKTPCCALQGNWTLIVQILAPRHSGIRSVTIHSCCWWRALKAVEYCHPEQLCQGYTCHYPWRAKANWSLPLEKLVTESSCQEFMNYLVKTHTRRSVPRTQDSAVAMM